MKRLLMSLVILTLITVTACQRDPHFITDKKYRAEVQNDFEARMSHLSSLSSHLQFDTLCRAEKEAMQFLYAYMPYSDLADYKPEFFLQQVRYAFKAREEMPWGKDIPEDVFRHFVLVYRVNNENLDTARMVFFRELKERVKGMTMEEAALEVNHWCHEHVAYRAADARTSAPLATMRTSLGRCGEESTFAVTALRAVGIPARQCYTPRWAHCDDNHAWVEVYTNGEWKFLGACEPDPELNMGWFAVPSTRCLMVHSKAFGKYKGDEEVVRRTSLYSELNLLSHYAPTRRVTVTACDVDGNPLEGVDIKFKMYNYAEYYTLATYKSDSHGQASLTTGLGDILVWATDGTHYNYAKVDVRQDSTVTLCLSREADNTYIDEIDIVPPVAGKAKVEASPEQAAANAKRIAYEDSLRAAYVATFPTKDDIQKIQGIEYLDIEPIWELVQKAEGNHQVILEFIKKHGWHEEKFGDVYDYLKTFSDKDLRDITTEVLEAHRKGYDWIDGEPYPEAVFKKGILPARISNEMVRPYREELSCFKGMTAEQIRQWTLDSIAVDDTGNYYNCPISPVGVYRLRHADKHSRDIFFVAVCRAANIPAYLDNATNTIYASSDGNHWEKVSFSSETSGTSSTSSTRKTSLTLVYRGKEPAKPVYWPHFTLAKLENGDLRTFDFEDDPRMATFPATLELEPGTYCLSTGNRYPDGAVRSRMEFFEIKAGEKVTKEIIILPLEDRNALLPTLNSHLELFDGIELSDYAGNAGMLYINLGDYSEPSKHLVVELRGLQKEMKAWGGMTLMVGPTSIGMPSWGLSNTDFAYQKGLLEQHICEAAKLGKVEYPLVALIDKEGRILYHSEGYKIGVVEQVLKATRH